MATPTSALLVRLQTAFANDAGSINAASALKVNLAQNAFTPSPSLVLGSLTVATFTGYAALAAGIGAGQIFNNPLTGNRVVQLLEPANGWHWQATNATGLPQTIFGWYVTDNAGAVLWGSALFQTPITLTNTGDAVDIPNVRFEIPPTALQ